MDQEVGGSSPPSCTSKINNLSKTAAVEKIAVSALCPQSQCGTSSPKALIAIVRSALYTRRKRNGICQQTEKTKNDPASTA